MHKITLIILAAFALAACGNDDSSGGDKHSPGDTGTDTEKTVLVDEPAGVPISLAVTDYDELPNCTVATNRQLIYIEDPGEFRVCRDEAWTVIQIKGEKGDPGQDAEPIPEEPIDLKHLDNSIKAIQVGDSLATTIPEAREYLLALGSYTKRVSTFTSTPDIETYIVAKIDSATECGYAYHYKVTLHDGLVHKVEDGCQ